MSDRAAAALATATLKDFEVISYDDTSFVIDRSKLRRERQKHRFAIQEEETVQFDLVNALYLDGKIDDTLTTVEINGKH